MRLLDSDYRDVRKAFDKCERHARAEEERRVLFKTSCEDIESGYAADQYMQEAKSHENSNRMLGDYIEMATSSLGRLQSQRSVVKVCMFAHPKQL